LRTRKPTCWFVNSVSDLFHEDVPDEFIAECFAIMARAHWHRFIILTKRAERMRDLLSSEDFCDLVDEMDGVPQKVLEEVEARAGRFDPNARMHGDARSRDFSITPGKPLANVITGVSIANQPDADRLVPILLQTPSACRAVSAEPLIGPVDLSPWLWKTCRDCGGKMHVGSDYSACVCAKYSPRPGYERRNEIHWLIAGGESGPNARPCDVNCIRSIVEQCKASGVPCFVKQVGSKPVGHAQWEHPDNEGYGVDPALSRLEDRKGGDPSEWPEDIRVRQFPEVTR